MADRLNESVGARAVQYLANASSPARELLGLGHRFGVHLARLVGVGNRDQSHLHARSKLAVVRFIQFRGRDRQLVLGQLAQCQRRPDNLLGVAIRFDAPLFLQQLQPLCFGEREATRHAVDLVVNLFVGDFDSAHFATGLDQHPVDHALEHFGAVVHQAFLSQLVAVDRLVVHEGRDRVLLRRGDGIIGRRGGFRRSGRRRFLHSAGRWFGHRLVGWRIGSKQHAHADDGHAAKEPARSRQKASQPPPTAVKDAIHSRVLRPPVTREIL